MIIPNREHRETIEEVIAYGEHRDLATGYVSTVEMSDADKLKARKRELANAKRRRSRIGFR